jgi:hypothetical protein
MMTKLLALSRSSGSFIAGFLIGLSIVVGSFALTDMESRTWQWVLIFGTPVILALGLALQALVTAEPRHRFAASVAPPPGALGSVRGASRAAALPPTPSVGQPRLDAATAT